MIHQGKIVVCCQGLIGGWEKRINGHWDLNPGLGSGPKSALPLNLYFPDHSSIPQEKIIYFFFAITSFLTWQHNSLLLSRIFGADCFLSSPAFPRFLSLASFISRGSPAFTIIPSSRQLHQSNNKSIKMESHCAASRATTSADRHATRLPPHQPPFTQERLASTSAPARDLQVGWGGNKARGGGNKARGRSTSTAQHQHILLWQL